MVSIVFALLAVFGVATIAATLSSSAAASELEPAPVLKFVYFVPSNIAFDPKAYAAMQTVAADYSAWNRQYFNGNAPNYKTDYVLGDHTWEWYVYNREEFNRMYKANMTEHMYHIALDLSRREIARKLNADPETDKNLKYILFMHEYAESEDTSECASEGYGAAWMPYENIQLVQTERIRPTLVLAHEMGHVYSLDHVGLDGDCMIGGFNNANKTCNYSPSNQALVLAKYGQFYTGTNGANLGARPAPPVCTAKIGDVCTGTNETRSCCPPEGYCQPVSSTEYKCMKRPVMCSDQLTDTDYYGNDIGQVYAATPDECCAQCSQMAGCRAYTYFYAGAPGIDHGTCYLKSLAGERTKSIGAVSGVILADWSTAPCTAKVGDPCNKNSINIRGCCPTGSYCMPWSPGNYKCAAIPKQCSAQRMDHAFQGHDMQLVITPTPEQCCDACSQTQGCKAYTYYASAVGSKNAGSCFLKSDHDAIRWEMGAVSGWAVTPKTCQNKIGDSCAVNPCCPADAFCQPTGTNTAQCMKQPVQSGVVRTNFDYAGNSIMIITVSSADKCSVACAQNPKCNFYSYYQLATTWDRGPGTCFLKSAAGPDVVSMGAVSGSIVKRDACDAKMGSECGASLCCPQGGYCQPWGNYNYQCLLKPPKCSLPLTDQDYKGNDLKMVYSNTPDECCEACVATPGCKTYTYLAITQPAPNNGACYLKTRAAGLFHLVAMPGAITGSVL